MSKSWSARSECIRRSYRYYLPASILGLRLDGGTADGEVLARLEAAWRTFEGHHAFHNYTRRRLYRLPAQLAGEGDRHARRRQQRGPKAGGGGEEEEGEEAEEEEAAAAPPTLQQQQQQEAAGGEEEGEEPEPRMGQVVLQWRGQADAADLVVKRHFRFMARCAVAPGVQELVPGGPPCVELSVVGNSFMLHQIRRAQRLVGVCVQRGSRAWGARRVRLLCKARQPRASPPASRSSPAPAAAAGAWWAWRWRWRGGSCRWSW